jgi:hypothetical protein
LAPTRRELLTTFVLRNELRVEGLYVSGATRVGSF